MKNLSNISNAEVTVAVVLGSIHPALGRRFVQGRIDAERGDITISTVMWVSMGVLMAAAIGVALWTKVKAKENSIDLNTPAAGVGN
jgi:hypothetical protein